MMYKGNQTANIVVYSLLFIHSLSYCVTLIYTWLVHSILSVNKGLVPTREAADHSRLASVSTAQDIAITYSKTMIVCAFAY